MHPRPWLVGGGVPLASDGLQSIPPAEARGGCEPQSPDVGVPLAPTVQGGKCNKLCELTQETTNYFKISDYYRLLH